MSVPSLSPGANAVRGGIAGSVGASDDSDSRGGGSIALRSIASGTSCESVSQSAVDADSSDNDSHTGGTASGRGHTMTAWAAASADGGRSRGTASSGIGVSNAASPTTTTSQRLPLGATAAAGDGQMYLTGRAIGQRRGRGFASGATAGAGAGAGAGTSTGGAVPSLASRTRTLSGSFRGAVAAIQRGVVSMWRASWSPRQWRRSASVGAAVAATEVHTTGAAHSSR